MNKDLHLAIVPRLVGSFRGFSQPSQFQVKFQISPEELYLQKQQPEPQWSNPFDKLINTTGESTVTSTLTSTSRKTLDLTKYSGLTPVNHFQFSTVNLPSTGIASQISIDRTTTVDSFTISVCLPSKTLLEAHRTQTSRALSTGNVTNQVQVFQWSL